MFVIMDLPPPAAPDSNMAVPFELTASFLLRKLLAKALAARRIENMKLL